MKKLISVFLCLTLLILSGCNSSGSGEQEDESILNEYLDNVSKFETPVREFGSPLSYLHMETGISVSILYPETGYLFIDRAIESWIDEITAEYLYEIKGKKDVTAELTVAYNSFITGDSIVSIMMEGTYLASYSAHPEEILTVFNADIKSNRFIGIKDIIKEKSYEDFLKSVVHHAGIDDRNADEHILDNAVITKEGIEVFLKQGDYLPMSDGTRLLVFKYEDIADLLNESFDYKSVQGNDGGSSPELPDNGLSSVVSEDKPMIALTFDDGPSAHTDRLLDILNRYGGKGTFFVIGNRIDSRKDTLVRIVNEGHEIGSHGWNHRQLTNLTDEEIKDQIMMTRAKIYDVTGKDCLIVRPSYGACNDAVKAVGRNLGVSFINWSVDTLDWKTKNAQAVSEEIMECVFDGAIILCHDLYGTTVDAMEIAVPRLIAEGYQLVTVSQLLEYSEKSLEAGGLYFRG